jgi:hypothetical protein
VPKPRCRRAPQRRPETLSVKLFRGVGQDQSAGVIDSHDVSADLRIREIIVAEQFEVARKTLLAAGRFGQAHLFLLSDKLDQS